MSYCSFHENVNTEQIRGIHLSDTFMFEDPASWPKRNSYDDWTRTEGISWLRSTDCRPYKRGKAKEKWDVAFIHITCALYLPARGSNPSTRNDVPLECRTQIVELIIFQWLGIGHCHFMPAYELTFCLINQVTLPLTCHWFVMFFCGIRSVTFSELCLH